MKFTTMKKTSILIATAFTAALFFTSQVKAQTTNSSPLRLGIGVEAGIPSGSIASDFEVGGTLRLQYDLAPDFALTFTSGYYDFLGKDVTTVVGTYKSEDIGIVPVKVGMKSFFAPNFYVGAEIGAGFETISDGHTKLILSPALGWANKTWDVGFRYENFSSSGRSYGLFGLRVAYAFGL
jgi:hypothetical protein